ncbi:unnamed protein product [Kuraishia capsulata CBS 1993]|uniref:Uncharacterized protein n=1 Tax=Kuraishia capsulata CBS 1993 TaxID=1382522 RepID=W6MUQ6_9ASCO|nr:uncharacterized protein KUCA_T00001805001 [Kuraishia capsulata CBS 1993]CDK25835.1 unnamed protein product [Kuraishia capsulata CBS 1993]
MGYTRRRCAEKSVIAGPMAVLLNQRYNACLQPWECRWVNSLPLITTTKKAKWFNESDEEVVWSQVLADDPGRPRVFPRKYLGILGIHYLNLRSWGVVKGVVLRNCGRSSESRRPFSEETGERPMNLTTMERETGRGFVSKKVF